MPHLSTIMKKKQKTLASAHSLKFMQFYALFTAWYADVRATSGTMALPAMHACADYRDCGCVCVCVCARDACVTGPRRATEACRQSVQLLPTGLHSEPSTAHGDTRSRSRGRNPLIKHHAQVPAGCHDKSEDFYQNQWERATCFFLHWKGYFCPQTLFPFLSIKNSTILVYVSWSWSSGIWTFILAYVKGSMC